MIVDLSLDSITHSPFNSRLRYSSSSIEEMANSMAENGQLVTVKVRPLADEGGKYELIFGHRRFLAAKKLKWKTIRAEVISASDQEVLQQSLIENFEREGLTDYEKACIFETLNSRYEKTYEEIGKMLGISKQHVSSYISMLRLFAPSDLAENPELRNALFQISEHHARVVSRVDDKETRANLLLMAVKNKLSVRDLTNIVSHLRSWFPTHAVEGGGTSEEPTLSSAAIEDVSLGGDKEDIANVVLAKFKLAQKGDFDSFKKLYLVGSGFTLLPSYPPFQCFEDERALLRERDWFYKKFPGFLWKIEDLKTTMLGGRNALITLKVVYLSNDKTKRPISSFMGTMVLVKNDVSWKILHEHWSKIEKPVAKKSKQHKAEMKIQL